MKHLSESPDRRFFSMTKPNNSEFRIPNSELPYRRLAISAHTSSSVTPCW